MGEGPPGRMSAVWRTEAITGNQALLGSEEERTQTFPSPPFDTAAALPFGQNYLEVRQRRHLGVAALTCRPPGQVRELRSVTTNGCEGVGCV